MAPLQAALGSSRVGFGGAKQAAAAAPRVIATPSGRRATTDAAVAVAAAASASASSSQHQPSETRLTRPEHGGRQLDIAGPSSQARGRSRRAGRSDGFASAVASLSASASAAPSFEQAEASSSSTLEEASASPSDAAGEILLSTRC